MFVKKELKKLSKSELIRIILRLESSLRRIEELLESSDTSYEERPEGQSVKEKKEELERKKKDKGRFPGREKGHKGAGIKLPKPDRTEKHMIDKPGYVQIGKRVKTVIEFAEKPIFVVKHVVYKYRAPDGSIVWADADLPDGIYGKNLQAFITLLKGKLGASHDCIADLIKSVRDDVSFCGATSLNLIDKMSHSLAMIRKRILEHIRMSFYCNSDDTGLKQDGVHASVWVFGTPTHVLYETDLSKSGEVPKRILGGNKDIIISCDGWQGYNGYKKQRCWPHLMRELDDLAEEDKEVQVQSNYFHKLYEKALKAKKKPPDEREKFVKIYDGKYQLSYMIGALSKIKSCKEFTTKLKNARPYLFTGVIHPEVPLDNNYSERKLKKIIKHRKLMGCIRNEKGQRFIENTMSAIETWHQQGKNIYQELINFAS